MQFALLELQRMLSAPKTWGLMIAGAFLVGFSGPFETGRLLEPVARIAYWFAVILCTFATGVYVFYFAGKVLEGRPRWIRVIAASIGNGFLGTLFVLVITRLFLHTPLSDPKFILVMAGDVTGVSAVIYIVLEYLPLAASDPVQSPKQPDILKRIEIEKRGQLISMTVSDHYVEISTAKGTSMILMRLSDAIAETSPVDGLQIHRSHWVAVSGISRIRKSGEKVFVITSDDRKLPVSRTYIKALKERNLLVP